MGIVIDEAAEMCRERRFDGDGDGRLLIRDDWEEPQ